MRLPSPEAIERDALGAPQVRAGVRRVAVEVFSEAELLARERAFDLGDYAEGMKIEDAPGGGPGLRVVASERKATWLEEGTGIYGPRRTPIRPKRGQFLVFRLGPESQHDSRARPLIFAREVKGRPASWVMRDASRRVADRLGLVWRNLRSFQG